MVKRPKTKEKIKALRLKYKIQTESEKKRKHILNSIELQSRGVRCLDIFCYACKKHYSFGYYYKKTSVGEIELCSYCKTYKNPQKIKIVFNDVESNRKKF